MNDSAHHKGKSKKEDRVEKIFQRFLKLWLKGDQPNPKAFVNNFPEIRDELERKINAFLFVQEGLEQETWQGKKLGEYVIVKDLGRGGMGIVFLANQVSLGRFVALKVLPMDAIFDARVVKHFYQEAKTIAKFHHPNIVPIYTVGEEQGAHYIAMAYVPGISLSRLIDLLRSLSPSSLKAVVVKELIQKHTPSALEQKYATKKDKPEGTHIQKSISVYRDVSFWQKSYIEFVSTIGLEIAEALNYAHENGIYHRDLKPSNILLTQDGIPVVVDFGLAREFGKETTRLSRGFVGTFAYASPEQIQSDNIGFQSDIWSLGVTLYELLTLKQPFEGKTISETSQRILEANPPLLRKLNRDIPKDLEIIVLKCLEKAPERRYPTAKALAEDLQSFLESRPIKARPASVATRLSRRVRLSTFAAVFSIGLIFSLMAAIFWFQNRDVNQSISKGISSPQAKNVVVFGKVTETISAQPVIDAKVTLGGKTVRTNENGDYKFGDVKTGSFIITVEAAELKRLTKTVTIYKGKNRTDITLSPVHPRNIDVNKFLPPDVDRDNYEKSYQDLNLDDLDEIILAYHVGEKLEPISFVKIIGWNGSEYAKIWESRQIGAEGLEKLEVRDINKNENPEIIVFWGTGAHAIILFLATFQEGSYREIGEFFGTNGVELTDEDWDAVEEVATYDREYADVESGDTAIVTLYKWNGSFYKIWKKYREGPWFPEREELPLQGE